MVQTFDKKHFYLSITFHDGKILFHPDPDRTVFCDLDNNTCRLIFSLLV